jgi:colanic acid biosynthesis glycosyl transferase WcaI
MHILVHDYAGHAFPIQLSRELARRKHIVTHAFAGGLLTPRGSLARRLEDAPGFSVVELPMSSHYRGNKYSFFKRRGYELAYGHELAALVERLRPDVIISGNTPTEPQWMMVKAARTADIPFLYWVQDFYSLAVDKLARKKLPIVGAWVGEWYRHLDRCCLQASAGVVAITKDFVPILSEFGVPADRVTVIPNWAPLDELPMLPRENVWAVRHSLEGKFVFIYSGTLAMKHNPDLLCQLAIAFRDDPLVQVLVISEGPGSDYLREKKKRETISNLILLPFQAFAEMPAVLASAEVLIAVLERDAGMFSVPSKVLTYHAAGRPILAAIPSGNMAASIIKQEGSGLCVEPEDAAGFVAAAKRLRDDVQSRNTMAHCARNYAQREFHIERIADRFDEVFRFATECRS